MLRDALPKIITPLPGPNAQKIIARREACMPNAIKCAYPCVIKRGEGAVFEDVDGNIFLDWIGGVGVLNIGYSNKDLIEAVKEQSEKYFHAMMNIVTHEPYIELAEKLNAIAPVKETKRKPCSLILVLKQMRMRLKLQRAILEDPTLLFFQEHFMEELC